MPFSLFIVNLLRVLLLKESKEYPCLPSGLVIFRRQTGQADYSRTNTFPFAKYFLLEKDNMFLSFY